MLTIYNRANTQSTPNYISVCYFLSAPFLIKISLEFNSYLYKQGFVRGPTMNSKLLFLRRQIESFQELFYSDEGVPTLQTVFRLKSLIQDHFLTCDSKKCFCTTWQNPLINSSNTKDVAEAGFSFLESWFEQLLKDQTPKPDKIYVILLVTLQVARLGSHIKASFNWSRFRSLTKNYYEIAVLQALFDYVQDSYIENLGSSHKEFYEARFLDGITFDRKCKQSFHDIENLRQVSIDFYTYLLETNPVLLDTLYKKGVTLMKTLSQTEKNLEIVF